MLSIERKCRIEKRKTQKKTDFACKAFQSKNIHKKSILKVCFKMCTKSENYNKTNLVKLVLSKVHF